MRSLDYPASQTPTANHVPRARENGRIDPGWVDATGLGVTQTPVPNGVPQALPSGKLDSGWIDFPEDDDDGNFAPLEAPYLLAKLDPSVPNARVIAGTPDQVLIDDGGINGELTLSLPQNIHAGASPTFAGLTLNGNITLPVDGVITFGETGTIGDVVGVLTITPVTDMHISGDLNLAGHLTMGDAKNIGVGSATGTMIASGTTQKIGFWGATPVVQGAAIADAAGGATVDAEARTALNTLLARMRTYGLIAT